MRSYLGFSELVVVATRIEHGMKNNKITSDAGTSNNNVKKILGGFQNKKEGKENAVSGGQIRNESRRKQQQPFIY